MRKVEKKEVEKMRGWEVGKKEGENLGRWKVEKKKMGG